MHKKTIITYKKLTKNILSRFQITLVISMIFIKILGKKGVY
jgi:hypothetical protein